jgi:hybrid cluster-associated redox disulfide protein
MATDPDKLSPLLTVKEVLAHYPQALHVFMELWLLCVGCPTEAFHTLADVAKEHDLGIEQLLQRIQAGIGGCDGRQKARSYFTKD